MAQADEIYQVIRDEIIHGVLPSDTPLRETELAKRFNVSRTPVREVLHRLASEKLIRTIPNAGSFVGAFTWETVNEVFAIRQILEAYAAGLTAERITDADLKKMETLYQEMEVAANKNDFEAYALLDEAFHEMINTICGNKLLTDIIHSLNDRAKLANLRREHYARGEIQYSLADHRKIIDLFSEHNASDASDILLSHGKTIFGGLTNNPIINVFKPKEK